MFDTHRQYAVYCAIFCCSLHSILEEAVQKEQGSIVSWYLREFGLAYAQVRRCGEAYAAFDSALQSDKSIANVERIAAARAALPVGCKTRR
jgi:hypothetical protein